MTSPTQKSSDQHARVFGSPGERPRVAGLVRTLWPALLGLVGLGYLLRCALPYPELGSTTVGILCILLALLMAGVLSARLRRFEMFAKGARGEEWVARELSFLPADFTVFHGLGAGRATRDPAGQDYDHVVVGPTGVFVVETKNWDGWITVEDRRILYDGNVPDRPPLEQVRLAADRLARLLKEACGEPIPVQPVLCFAANALRAPTAVVDGAAVCNIRDLNACVIGAGERLPRDRCLKIIAHLERLHGQAA